MADSAVEAVWYGCEECTPPCLPKREGCFVGNSAWMDNRVWDLLEYYPSVRRLLGLWAQTQASLSRGARFRVAGRQAGGQTGRRREAKAGYASFIWTQECKSRRGRISAVGEGLWFKREESILFCVCV